MHIAQERATADARAFSQGYSPGARRLAWRLKERAEPVCRMQEGQAAEVEGAALSMR